MVQRTQARRITSGDAVVVAFVHGTTRVVTYVISDRREIAYSLRSSAEGLEVLRPDGSPAPTFSGPAGAEGSCWRGGESAHRGVKQHVCSRYRRRCGLRDPRNRGNHAPVPGLRSWFAARSDFPAPGEPSPRSSAGDTPICRQPTFRAIAMRMGQLWRALTTPPTSSSSMREGAEIRTSSSSGVRPSTRTRRPARFLERRSVLVRLDHKQRNRRRR
jgi:hypothetical protein